MTTAPSEALKLYGTEQEAPAARTLSAGGLTAALDAGKLRWIRYGGTEALRGLAFVVRGSGWETYAPEISNLEIEEGADGFRVGYDARIESPDGVLAYRADIVADGERSLVFAVEFEPETEFRTSRTGFVALHPVEGVAGEACSITHSDGTVEETAFPGLIMPLQPFFDISAMRHRVSPGVWLTCRFEGADPWETEDQRNWTDASYKTYYRPLALPYPYPLAAGERLRQVATLTFEGSARHGGDHVPRRRHHAPVDPHARPQRAVYEPPPALHARARRALQARAAQAPQRGHRLLDRIGLRACRAHPRT